MNTLIIGGTRNLGRLLTQALLEAGHAVTVLNRGITPNDLSPGVDRLVCDRTDPQQFHHTLQGHNFDAIVDMVLYKGSEAEAAVKTLNGYTGHYIFISTGQVYLVREDIVRPFREDEYAGRLIPPPKDNTYPYEEWTYGKEKRDAEDVFAASFASQDFPYTSLRLPMVNSQHDPFNRLYGYFLRLQDGGPLLVPETPRHSLRHVYGPDVIRAIMTLIENGPGKSRAYNISQDETVSLDEFLALLGDLVGHRPQIVRLKRSLLDANGFLPDCSPFSERWMSELDNSSSKTDLNMVYTPLPVYLRQLVEHYQSAQLPMPLSYRRRQAEIHFLQGAARDFQPQ